VVGVPSFAVERPSEGTTVSVDSVGAAGAVVGAGVLVGLCVAALFYGLLAQAVREGRALPQRFLADFAALWIWLLSLLALVVVIGLGIVLPVAFFASLLASTVPTISAILSTFALAASLWAIVYLFFTTHALFVSRVPPLTAVQRSVEVVRHNFWSTLFFIALFIVISTGLPKVWEVIADVLQVPGIVLGIVGNDYILAGLAAGSMTFYYQRVSRLTATQSDHK